MKSILKFSFLVNQFSIFKLGLIGKVDIVDMALFDIAKDMFASPDTKKIIYGGRQWTWIAFGSIKDRAPILMLKNKEAIGRRFKKLCEIGIFDKIDPQQTGNKTYFSAGRLFGHVDYFDEKSPPSDFQVDSLPTGQSEALSTLESNKSPNHFNSTNQKSIEMVSKETTNNIFPRDTLNSTPPHISPPPPSGKTGPENVLWDYFKASHLAIIPTSPVMDWFPFLSSVKKHMKNGMTVDKLKKMMDAFFADPYQARLGYPQKNFWGGISKYAMEGEGVRFEQKSENRKQLEEFKKSMEKTV